MNDLRNLEISEMIVMNNDNIRPTKIGETMAKYHIKYLTMQRILSIFSWCQKNSTSSKEEIIDICLQKVSQAEEFNEVKLHRHEKLV